MSRHSIRWLYRELPTWVQAGLITDETAERIRTRYGPVEAINRNALAMTIFACLGAVAIGLGVIMLIAHNWDELGRGTRTVLSFLPLLVGQGLAAWVLAYRPESTAWREGTGAALVLAIGSSISLISQTYNISGEFDHFILTWMVLGAPLAYLLRSNMAAALYLAGLAAWPHAAAYTGLTLFYWGLLAIIAPYCLYRLTRFPDSLATAWLAWAICFSLVIALNEITGLAVTSGWRINYLGLFTTFILVDRLTLSENRGQFHRAFAIAGIVGLLIVSMILSYGDFWPLISTLIDPHAAYESAFWVYDGLIALGFVCAGLYLSLYSLQRKRPHDVLIGLMPLLSMLSLIWVVRMDDALAPALLFNAFLLALGAAYIVSGLKALRMSSLNLGVLILTFLILFRFMDEGFGLIERGVAFIVMGALFLGVNVYVVRKTGTVKGDA